MKYLQCTNLYEHLPLLTYPGILIVLVYGSQIPHSLLISLSKCLPGLNNTDTFLPFIIAELSWKTSPPKYHIEVPWLGCQNSLGCI